MGKTLADALTAQPDPNSLGYWVGGPEHQRQMVLREKMRREDPAKFMSLRRRGFDPYEQQEMTGGNGAPQAFAPEIDPQVMFSPNVARAYSVLQTPEQQAAQNLSELVRLSRSSPRGMAQQAANQQNDAALASRINHITNAHVPADYGDGNFSWDRKALDALMWLTGQGGGMR